MAEASRGLLFRKRNILGAALVAGIGLGVWLGGFKGLFFGSGNNYGLGTNDGKGESKNSEPVLVSTETPDELPAVVPDVVKILIDDKEFLVRRPNEDVPMSLESLIKLIKQARGDDDGVRVRIYMKSNARALAEEKLKQALVDANISQNAVFWVPTEVKDFETRRSDSRKTK